MDRKVVLASLKAITYASGRAYVALSKGDTAAYLNDLGSIEQSLAAIHAEHRADQSSGITPRKTNKRAGGRSQRG
jgi:hypothetical protein